MSKDPNKIEINKTEKGAPENLTIGSKYKASINADLKELIPLDIIL